MALNEVDVAIRRKIKTGFTDKDRPCAMELAQLATSGEYSGFEDPKVAAQEALETAHRQPWQAGKRPDFLECERDGCESVIRLRARYDGFLVEVGTCALGSFCLEEAWDGSRKIQKYTRVKL